MHTSELTTAEIQQRCGFLPSFFAAALHMPDVLEQLWRQTLTAYLDNPLPEALKERLFAYLSRLRSCAYCVARHSGRLHELGLTGREVFDLLEPRLPDAGSSSSAEHPLAPWPPGGSHDEDRIIALAGHAFMRGEDAESRLAELRGLLGPTDYAWLVILLSHIASCHDWVRAHPDVDYRDDAPVMRHVEALVREEPRLGELFDAERARTNAPAPRDHLAAIVESADDAIVGETLEGVIVSCNRAAERLLGYAAETILGMSSMMLVPADRRDEMVAVMQRIRVGERVDPFDTVRVGRDGRRLEVSLTVSPIRNGAGAVTGASSIARDVGARKARERYLQTLHHATRVLAQSETIEEALPALLRVIGEGMGWAVGAAWVPTRHGTVAQLRCAAFWRAPELDGSSFETASRELRLRAGDGLPGRVWESGQARWVADVTAEPHSRRAEEAQQDGLHTCYLLPIPGRAAVVAVMEFLSDEIRPPDPLVLEMLNRLSGQVGAFLERKGAELGLAVGVRVSA